MAIDRRQSLQIAVAALVASQAGRAFAAVPAKGGLSLEQQAQRLWDAYEIQNLQARFEYFQVAGMHRESAQLFALKTPGVKLESSRGVYEGADGVQRFFAGLARNEGDRVGHLHLHTVTTPVVEVADDGRTAQAIWLAPGVDTTPRPDGVSANWDWRKYGVDYVKEAGEWKFWHFHTYRIFSAPYDKSWGEVAAEPARKAPDADRPTTYDWVYSPTVATENIPAAPTPYAVWNDARAMVK